MAERGYLVLKEIVSSFDTEQIDFVVTAQDKNVQEDYSKEIITLADENNITTIDRNSPYKVQSAYALAISWRWLIPIEPRQTRLIVLHDSLLPKYRGFAPLVSQLVEKESTLGVTAFFAAEEFDKGEIIAQQKANIHYPIKIKEAIAITARLYCNITHNLMNIITRDGQLESTPQKEEEATYSLWRDKEDYCIDWTQQATRILRFIHAVGDPYLGACAQLQGRVVRILDAELENDLKIVNRDCGKILFIEKEYPVVVCGEGLLKITSAIYDDNGKSIFPLEKFRLRFK